MEGGEKTTKKRHPATGADKFTDEELLALEQDFIDLYLTGDGKIKPLKIIFRMYRPFWRDILFSILVFLVKNSPVYIFPVVTANIINAVAYLSGQELIRQLIVNIALMAFLFLLNVPTHSLYVHFHSKVVRKAEAGLRGAMVRKLQQLSITFHKEMQSGRIQSKLMRDVETIQALSEQLFTQIPSIVLGLLVSLSVVLTKNVTIFFFFLLTVPVAVFTVRIFQRGIGRRNAEFRRDLEYTSAGLMEMVEMTPITRAHALENKEVSKMNQRLNKVANTGYRLDMLQALFGSCSWVAFSLFQLLCLCFSAWLAYRGTIKIGDISLYQSYFTALTGYVSTFIGLLPIMTKGLESVHSVGEILGNTDIEDNRDKIKIPALRGEYDFRNVHFSYEEDQPLLRGLDLRVRQGETIAIVGESGSGKSTILNLVIGFNLAQSGEVLVDGVNIKDIDLHSYRKHIAIVPQNSVLFTGTIRENITYGINNPTEEQISSAVEAAQLSKFVASLPKGLDTMLEEHGANLSGGQRQRLSIARAIIRNPDVIIFDEATSALDSISEKEIQQAIQNLTGDKTTFIVAHRLSTIKNADRIAVIKNGVCAEIGSYDELMAKKGEFYAMQTAQ